MHTDDHSSTELDQFAGFDTARHILMCFEARTNTYRRLRDSELWHHPDVMAIHIQATECSALAHLAGFDSTGYPVNLSSVCHGSHPESTPALQMCAEFKLGLEELPTSIEPLAPLTMLIRKRRGWVADMAKVRTYNLKADRNRAQRAMFLAHMGDLAARGEIKSNPNGPLGS